MIIIQLYLYIVSPLAEQPYYRVLNTKDDFNSEGESKFFQIFNERGGRGVGKLSYKQVFYIDFNVGIKYSDAFIKNSSTTETYVLEKLLRQL